MIVWTMFVAHTIFIGGIIAPGHVHREYHDKGWIIIIPLGIVLGIAFQFFVKQYNIIFFVIFFYLIYYLGNFIEPDNDLISLTNSDSDFLSMKKLVGFILLDFPLGLIGLLLAIWSFIYAWVIGWFGSHRSPLSHWIIIGTIGRIIWWHMPLVFIGREIYLQNNWHDWYFQFYCDYWLVSWCLGLISLFISDTIHVILDLEIVKGILYVPEPTRRN